MWGKEGLKFEVERKVYLKWHLLKQEELRTDMALMAKVQVQAKQGEIGPR